MATLKEYFENEFNMYMTTKREDTLRLDSESVTVTIRIHFDHTTCTVFFSYYVPPCSVKLKSEVCHKILNDFDWGMSVKSFTFSDSFKGEGSNITSEKYKFNKRIFIYGDSFNEEADWPHLIDFANKNDILLTLRGKQWMEETIKWEKPLAFICHDSRDKESIASILAIELLGLSCPVWYDEFSLRVGDRLRQTIEKGIRECNKCILIITPNFINNDGWTKVEFNSIFTREIIERDKVILPVWHGVNEKEIYQYCPSLADRFAVKWELGKKVVAQTLYKEIV